MVGSTIESCTPSPPIGGRGSVPGSPRSCRRWVVDYRVVRPNLTPRSEWANTLRELGVTGLVWQHRIRLPSGRWARFDLAIPSRRIAIEVDVHPRHDETAGRLADESRDEGAAVDGWITVRIARADYHDRCTERLAEVADQIRTHRAMSEPAG